MTDVVIRSEGLGKRYQIGEREPYRALRDTLTDALYAPARRLRSLLRESTNGASPAPDTTFWALRDVSFDVRHGQVVGIIGRNGAGKSTLLKILSRITKPTEGQVRIRGRVGSLLEVGTGFHPELTGRDNIYLNGAILGMRKAEIDRKFDDIVAFAEVERFIDTPVKRYSSGMYVRLAFAVAAHLEPEILIVDEVLAVGDAAFQKKCLGKMGDVAQKGRTVVFVSHQMNHIRRLCDRCIWLDRGRVEKLGATVDVVAAYEVASSETRSRSISSNGDDRSAARFLTWRIVEPAGSRPNVLSTMKALTVTFVLRVKKPVRDGHHSVLLYNGEGQVVWSADVRNVALEVGLNELTYTLPGLPLRPGIYSWLVNLYDRSGEVDTWEAAPELVIAMEPLTHSMDQWAGILNVPHEFSIQHRQG